MEQEKLEERVKEIFEEQGFKVVGTGNRLEASNGEKKLLAVFSSERYSSDDVREEVDDEDIVFVDEPLGKLDIGPEVSVIREDDSGKDYDLPSYELIGKIAVINELNDHETEEVVEGIREHHPQVKTILLKEEPLEGEFRVGEYEKLYGEETETVHKEFGCRYKVDPTKVYFSERFGTERRRVIDQIGEGERVLVMFAGAGPFAVMAARLAEPETVIAVEKNPVAAAYLEENIELNNMGGTVSAVEGDVSEVVPEMDKFDRIVMPLPESADQFLELAFRKTREGGKIHYYRFVEDENMDPALREIEEASDKTGRDYEIVGTTECGERGPGSVRTCFDINVF